MTESRRDIFIRLLKSKSDLDVVEITHDAVGELIEVLEEPERKTGRWIIHRDWIANGECGYECSECGRCYDYDMNYCGYCGAKLEVEHED